MIVADESVFPNNVVELIAMRMANPAVIDPDVNVLRRPLRNTDPDQSIGVFAQLWLPEEDSLEMMGSLSGAPQQPTLQTYSGSVQAFIKDGDEERGLAVHSIMSARVRSVLYRDNPLRLALQGLSVTYTTGAVETLKRWGIRTQRYFSNEIDAQWLYLSTLEFFIETETK